MTTPPDKAAVHVRTQATASGIRVLQGPAICMLPSTPSKSGLSLAAEGAILQQPSEQTQRLSLYN